MKSVLILSGFFDKNCKEILNYFSNFSDIEFKVATNSPKSKVIKGLRKANINAFYLPNNEIESYILAHNFDLIILSSFEEKLSEEIVENNYVVNLHSSLLPKYNVANPIEKAFINREVKTGITIYRVNENIENFEILFQKEIEINQKWSLSKLTKEVEKLEKYYYPRIVEKILGLNVLVLGNSSKEHVIIQKISKSKFLNKLFIADNNSCFDNFCEKILYDNYGDLAQKLKKLNINLVITASKEYFFSGLVDVLTKYQIKVIGVDKKNSKIENSKIFTKKLLRKYDIKTSQYRKIANINEIERTLKYFKNPVIKTNGYSFGKGVYLDLDYSKAMSELQKLINGKFDTASKTCLVEEKLFGYEVVLYSLWDGENLLHFPLCQNYKINEDGLNTSGLASICPIELDKDVKRRIETYKIKLAALLKGEKISTPFVFCSNLMISDGDIYALGCNTFFGDCDIEALMNFIADDWLELFFDATIRALFNKNLTTTKSLQMTSILLYSKGYPLKTRKNLPIRNIEKMDDSIEVYFSNIIKKDGEFLSLGDNILTVVSDDKANIYRYLNRICFEDKTFKTKVQVDLGK